MSLQKTTADISTKINQAPGSVGTSILFDFGDEGCIHVDDSGDSPEVSNDTCEAECTISCSLDTFNELVAGDLNPMMAVMTGKVKIDGNMSIAMKLQTMFG